MGLIDNVKGLFRKPDTGMAGGPSSSNPPQATPGAVPANPAVQMNPQEPKTEVPTLDPEPTMKTPEGDPPTVKPDLGEGQTPAASTAETQIPVAQPATTEQEVPVSTPAETMATPVSTPEAPQPLTKPESESA